MDVVVICPKCNRNNAVRRTACLYCGAALPVTDESASVQVPVLRPVDDHEMGFSVVLAPLDREAPTDRQLARFCEITHMGEELAQSVFASRVSLPVARVPTEGEANLVARLLGESELGATVVPDVALELGRMARRVRELRLGPELIEARVLFGDWIALRRDEMLVAVEGHVVSTQVEIVETATGKRGKMNLDDTSQFFSESYAIDLYGPSIDASVRVKADSFDFGCLGRTPSPRLDENIANLAHLLREYLGASRYDASFAKVAKLLEHAWPSASSVSSKGLLFRGNFKRYTRSSVTTDGAAQFNRYSRMRYALATAAV